MRKQYTLLYIITIKLASRYPFKIFQKESQSDPLIPKSSSRPCQEKAIPFQSMLNRFLKVSMINTF